MSAPDARAQSHTPLWDLYLEKAKQAAGLVTIVNRIADDLRRKYAVDSSGTPRGASDLEAMVRSDSIWKKGVQDQQFAERLAVMNGPGAIVEAINAMHRDMNRRLEKIAQTQLEEADEVRRALGTIIKALEFQNKTYLEKNVEIMKERKPVIRMSDGKELNI